MVWAFKCSGAHSQCTGDGKGWFKIDQMGMWGNNPNSENWGTATVLKTGKWSSKIPSNLKPGNYLIRHELLALHQANTPQYVYYHLLSDLQFFFCLLSFCTCS